jgi:hypothetical protein
MDTQNSSMLISQMENNKGLAVLENQTLEHHCPQCNGLINWYKEGEYWHAQCSSCTLKLSGHVTDSAQVEPTFSPEENSHINMRGC